MRAARPPCLWFRPSFGREGRGPRSFAMATPFRVPRLHGCAWGRVSGPAFAMVRASLNGLQSLASGRVMRLGRGAIEAHAAFRGGRRDSPRERIIRSLGPWYSGQQGRQQWLLPLCLYPERPLRIPRYGTYTLACFMSMKAVWRTRRGLPDGAAGRSSRTHAHGMWRVVSPSAPHEVLCAVVGQVTVDMHDRVTLFGVALTEVQGDQAIDGVATWPAV